ncbi:GMC family oxidoreductase [Streptomyces tendae]|uniref:GMC family oxidoreductase n=1 Tax=Streptomyces tendae TaxID=1932 RepID=UPI0036A5B624
MSFKNLVDYIIVGGGAAGMALAHQLGRNRQNRVLVIEAGGSDRYQRYPVPARFTVPSAGSQYRYRHSHQESGAGAAGQGRAVRAIGDSAPVNGMILSREADYEAWQAAGISGWNWPRFSEAFTALERHFGGSTGRTDSDGHRPVEAVDTPEAASRWWIDALASQGIDAVENLHCRGEQSMYLSQSVSNSIRTSGARSLLRGRARRPNVRVRLHCTAQRILFDGTTATGVEVKTPRGTVLFTARREIVICAGTLGSPLLLERSGVGDPEILTPAGVHLVAENPAVGCNLRQRRGAVLTLRLNGVQSGDREPATPAARLRARLASLLRPAGVQPRGGTAVLAVMSSDRRESTPDMELLFTPLQKPDHDGISSGTGDATVAFYPQTPTSFGSVHITGPTLKDPPQLVPGYLATERDMELTVAAFARTREVLAAEPVASTMAEAFPGPDVEEAADVLQFVLDHGFTQKHEVGTCALGPGGVVDDELRVHGTHRLRVADASVMPELTTGDTEATSMAIGWIAGDILRNANTHSR